MQRALKKPQPTIVVALFLEILKALITLLASLSLEACDRPTACTSWSVKDVVLHLLGDNVMLSSGRDGHASPISAHSWEELVASISEWNKAWVQTTRGISPRLLIDFLEFTGRQVCAHFRSLDLYAIGSPVSWAGPDPAPVWLDVAREYTKRWHHHQHIRDAVGRCGLTEPRFPAPVLDTFVRALPHTFRGKEAQEKVATLGDQSLGAKVLDVVSIIA